jgi:hypothetical protein
MKYKLTLSIDSELVKEAKIAAIKQNVKLSDKVAELLRDWLRQSADKERPP